jgi:hypothetical protein
MFVTSDRGNHPARMGLETSWHDGVEKKNKKRWTGGSIISMQTPGPNIDREQLEISKSSFARFSAFVMYALPSFNRQPEAEARRMACPDGAAHSSNYVVAFLALVTTAPLPVS